jgi:hypothetical protein
MKIKFNAKEIREKNEFSKKIIKKYIQEIARQKIKTALFTISSEEQGNAISEWLTPLGFKVSIKTNINCVEIIWLK